LIGEVQYIGHVMKLKLRYWIWSGWQDRMLSISLSVQCVI